MKVKQLSLEKITTKIGSGKTPLGGDSVYVESGTSIIRSQNVYNLSFKYEGLAYVDDRIASQMKNVEVQSGDVLLNITGDSVARCTIVPEDVLPARVNQHVCIIRGNPEVIDQNYLSYYMVSPYMQKHMLSIAGFGGTRKALSKQLIDKFEVPVPDLLVQKKIVDVLKKYGELIDVNNRKIALLEESARLIYKEWFVNLRYPGHEKVKVIHGLPEDWKIVSLGDICTRITDGAHHSPQSVDEGYSMASVKDMESWGIKESSCRKIKLEDYEHLVRNDCKPLVGDVLIAKDGSYLKHVFPIYEDNPYVILSSIAILRPNEKTTPEFLTFYLLDPSIKKKLAGFVSGVAIQRIILKDFRKFSIKLPTKELIDNFTFYVRPNLLQIQLLRKQNEMLLSARDLLLPRLINGDIEL